MDEWTYGGVCQKVNIPTAFFLLGKHYFPSVWYRLSIFKCLNGSPPPLPSPPISLSKFLSLSVRGMDPKGLMCFYSRCITNIAMKIHVPSPRIRVRVFVLSPRPLICFFLSPLRPVNFFCFKFYSLLIVSCLLLFRLDQRSILKGEHGDYCYHCVPLLFNNNNSRVR